MKAKEIWVERSELCGVVLWVRFVNGATINQEFGSLAYAVQGAIGITEEESAELREDHGAERRVSVQNAKDEAKAMEYVGRARKGETHSHWDSAKIAVLTLLDEGRGLPWELQQAAEELAGEPREVVEAFAALWAGYKYPVSPLWETAIKADTPPQWAIFGQMDHDAAGVEA